MVNSPWCYHEAKKTSSNVSEAFLGFRKKGILKTKNTPGILTVVLSLECKYSDSLQRIRENKNIQIGAEIF